MYTDFFRTHLPYGFSKNENGDWFAFNRESKPIGCNSEVLKKDKDLKLPVYFHSSFLSDRVILKIMDYDENVIERDDKGDICRFWLYDDQTNPLNQKNSENNFWDIYWLKLKAIAKLPIYFS